MYIYKYIVLLAQQIGTDTRGFSGELHCHLYNGTEVNKTHKIYIHTYIHTYMFVCLYTCSSRAKIETDVGSFGS